MKKIIVFALHVAVLATILFLALSTITFAVGMTSGPMFSCPLMTSGHSVVCPMTAANHIAGWKLLIAAIVEQSLMMSMLIIVAAVFLHQWIKQRQSHPPSLAARQRYRAYSIIYQLHHYLLDAFSKGILHSKLYT